MKRHFIIFWCFLQLLYYTSVNSNEIRQKRTAVFPLRSFYDLFVAIIFPLEKNKNVFISYNLSINYYLPFNTTEWGDMSLFAPITENRLKRHLTKRSLYIALEDQLNRLGFVGRSCLLRIICEASETKLFRNGVLGDILHVILTPSSSLDEGLPLEFYHAENQGNNGDCSDYSIKCSESFLDTISKFE